MSKKQVIRINESQLRQIVTESVKKVLNELNWKTYANAAKKRVKQGEWDKSEQLAQFATDKFNDEFGYDEIDGTYDDGGLPYHQEVKGRITPYGEYVGMGRWTPMHSQMHAGYYPGTDDKEYHDFNINSKMKPTKNIADKYQKAADEIEKFYNGETKYVKGKGWQ